MNKPNILVVCGRNKKRSKTAEYIFKNDQRLNIRSAGLSPQSARKLSENDLRWADMILVMETDQRSKIFEQFPEHRNMQIEVLDIPDDYEFMDEELVDMLQDKIDSLLETHYGS